MNKLFDDMNDTPNAHVYIHLLLIIKMRMF